MEPGGQKQFAPFVASAVPRHFTPDTGGPAFQTVDATLVFADVSGFTALSERLARKGREGAEQLAGLMDGCFAGLLELASAQGGSLLKFGGDALLLLFEEEFHAVRACRTALDMHVALRERDNAIGGTLAQLRMSIGVHTGDVHLFVAGTSHRELLVAGPAATAVVLAESLARSGETALTASTAERVPAGCLGTARGEHRLLRRAPDELPSIASSAPALVRAEDYVSTAVRAHIGAGAPEPDHRMASVAFVRFAGLNELICAEGADAAARELHGLVSAVQVACDDQRVSFLDSDVATDGGKLMLVAGAPRLHGDDDERLLLTLRRILEHPTPLQLSAGANRGRVFAGAIGPAYRQTYTVMGDSTNLAARVMAQAPAGSLLATRAVIDRSRTRFAITPVEPFVAKGKRQPVEAVTVGPVLDLASTSGQGSVGPIYGRDAELAALSRALQEARTGRGTVVDIAGEVGIGKTRLLEALRDEAEDFHRVHIVCGSYSASTPYAATRRLLRTLAQVPMEAEDAEVIAQLRELVRSDVSLEPFLPLLANAFGSDAADTPATAALAPEFRKGRLHDTVATFLAPHLATPRLVEIEDAHAMDVASAELLESLVASLPASRWLMVVTRREEGAAGFPSENASGLRLRPQRLSPAAALQLAESLTEHAWLRPDLLHHAVHRSGGNPQFLRDLIGAAVVGEQDLPESIEAAATARIDHLAAGDRQLVRRASVLGMSFKQEWLSAVLAEPPEKSSPVWQRLEQYFYREAGIVHFRRAADREAAYLGIAFATRRQLHAAAASHIAADLGDRPDPWGVLSLHCLLAGDDRGAWRHARDAADRARMHSAHADAVSLYRRALDAAARLELDWPDRAAAWEGLGDAYEAVGDPSAAIHAWRSARRLAHGADPVREARLLDRTALLCMDSRGIHSAVRWAQRGLRLLESVDAPTAKACRANITVTLATIRQRQGRMVEAAALCRQAIEQAAGCGEDAALARASYILDWALVESGQDPAGGSERALSIYERLGEVWRRSFVLNNLGGFAYRDGRWDDAAGLWEQAAAAAEQAGDVVGVAFAELNLGQLRSDQGRSAEGTAHLERALRIFRGTKNEFGIARTLTFLGRAAMRDGRPDEGRADLLEAIERHRHLGTDDEGYVHALLAEAQAVAGDSAAATATIDAVIASGTLTAFDLPRLHRVRGIALLRSGDLTGAAQELRASIETARSCHDLFAEALALDWLEQLPDREARDRRRRDEILQRLGIDDLPRDHVHRDAESAHE